MNNAISHSNPFFSILIPSFNRPVELKRCVESVLKSSFDDFEIIVSDDNSPQKIEITEVMSAFSENKKVIFFQQPFNLKEPGNKNFLVSKAIGKFNIVIGDDDVIGANTLSSLHTSVVENPAYDIYGFGYFIVNEYNQSVSIHSASNFTVLSTKDRVKFLFEFGVSPMGFIHPATFCCRAGIEREISYREDVGIGEDLCFLLQAVARDYSLVAIPLPLFNWRKVQNISAVDQGNQSAEHLASFKAKYLTYQVLRKEIFSNQSLYKYILSPLFRFKFLYMEILADPIASQLSGSELGIDFDTEGELDTFKNSFFYRLRVRARRLFGFVDLCRIIGVASALQWIIKFLSFRAKNTHNAK